MHRWSKVFVNHDSGRKSWVIEVKNNRNHEYQDSNDFASTRENIVNSNTFLFQWNNCLKVTLIWILAIQHSNILKGEGYNFLGTHFWRGQDFWAVNWTLARLVSLQKQVYCQPRKHELYRGVRGHAHAPPEKITENWTLGNDISCIPWIERN